MKTRKEHISVCICTYRRPALLKKLLENLLIQETGGSFELSVSVVDNDIDMSGKPIVDYFLKSHRLEIVYTCVRERNLALLRNRSIENSKGDYIAFVDDDECPSKNWLLLLHNTMHRFQASGALGPVLPDYQTTPPKWVQKGRFCERARYRTGDRLQAWQTRTGNALLRRDIFLDPQNLFDLKFSIGGEDDTLFERLINRGHVFIWCDEAVVFEAVPAARLTVSYFLKRSRLIGFMSYSYLKDTRPWHVNFLVCCKSFAAVLIYSVLLPVSFVRGFHYFVDALIRLSHHIAVLQTCLGVLKINTRDL